MRTGRAKELSAGQLETKLAAWNLKKEAAIQRFRATPPWQQEEEQLTANVTVEAHESLDRLCGSWHVFQLKKGHRFSLDDIVCSWRAAHAMPHATRLLDLGCGIGSVGLSTLHKIDNPEATMVGLEAQEISVAHSIRLHHYCHRPVETRASCFPSTAPQHQMPILIPTSLLPGGAAPKDAGPQSIARPFQDFSGRHAAHLSPRRFIIRSHNREPPLLARKERPSLPSSPKSRLPL